VGKYLVQTFNASTTLCRYSFLVVLVLTGAFGQHPPTSDAIVVNSCPPGAVALARFIATQTSNSRTPVETIEIEASFPKLKQSGRLYAIRRIVSARHLEYQILEMFGDSMVKQQLIARYLYADRRALELSNESTAITPANYKFAYLGTVQLRDDLAYAFRLIPRKKKLGLINGVVWIDGDTGIAVRLSGYLVKTPSMFLKRVNLTREASLREGIVETRITHLLIDTRLVGSARLVVVERPTSDLGTLVP
jgi:hypothetical protein